MRRQLASQQGSALVLVLLMTVIFTVIGLSLVAGALNGTKRTEYRESEVQATFLAQKGIDYFKEYMHRKIEENRDEDGNIILSEVNPASDFDNLLGQWLTEYESVGKTFSEGDDVYTVKVSDRHLIHPSDTSDLSQEMTIKSTAIVRDVTKTVSATIQLNAIKTPDHLKYAVGSYDPCKDAQQSGPSNCAGGSFHGEANMFLLGGVSIKGDVYVEGNLVTHNETIKDPHKQLAPDIQDFTKFLKSGKFSDLYDWWKFEKNESLDVESDYPSMEPLEGEYPANLVVGEDAVRVDPDRNNIMYSQITDIDNDHFAKPGNKFLPLIGNVESGFTSYQDPLNPDHPYIPNLIHRDPDLKAIQIEEQRDNFYFDGHSNDRMVTERSGPILEDQKDSGKNIYLKKNTGLFDTYFVKNSNTFGSLSVPGQLVITADHNPAYEHPFFDDLLSEWNRSLSGDKSEFISILSTTSSHPDEASITFENGLYVQGDLVIGDPFFDFTHSAFDMDERPFHYRQLQIKGPIFVDGDLYIKGADVQFDSSIYVTGETDISYSLISGINEQIDGEQVEKSLVVLSKGDLGIHHIGLFQNGDEVKNRLRGFFYSESTLELFGTSSTMEIDGGVFGRKVLLNAVKGKVENESFLFWEHVSFDSRSAQEKMSPEKSRLKIIYNPDLIQNPPEGLPKALNVELKVVDRSLD